MSTDEGKAVGTAVVTVQLALMIGLAAAAAPAFLGLRAPAPAWALALASVLLGLWALTANRIGNFNITPAPRAGGRMVSEGPYRWIRHPMYTSMIGFCGACAWAQGSAWAGLSEAALVAVLWFKAGMEERWMLQAHPGYAAYRSRTHRFLPGLV